MRFNIGGLSMDYLKMIKEHNLKVVPILVEDCWGAGKMILNSTKTCNYMPFKFLAKGKTLEEAILRAVDKIKSEGD